MMSRGLSGAMAIAASCALWAGAAWADTVRLFSYDPANAQTRAAAGALTFEFKQRLVGTTMLNVRATEAQATAYLRPAPDKALGQAGLTPLIGPAASERDLYEVLSSGEGPALISAFCPGARRAWMAFGRPRLNRDLRVFVLGDTASGGPVRLCRTLDFNFRGEWRLPTSGVFDETLLPKTRGPRS